jgi:hypothetical protein
MRERPAAHWAAGRFVSGSRKFRELRPEAGHQMDDARP